MNLNPWYHLNILDANLQILEELDEKMPIAKKVVQEKFDKLEFYEHVPFYYFINKIIFYKITALCAIYFNKKLIKIAQQKYPNEVFCTHPKQTSNSNNKIAWQKFEDENVLKMIRGERDSD